MENVFLSSEQEPLETDTNMACSVLAYINKEGSVMFETFWSDEEESKNVQSLISLLCSIRHGSFIESGLASAIESCKDQGDEQTLNVLNYVLEKYNSFTLDKTPEKSSGDNKGNSLAVRPLLAK